MTAIQDIASQLTVTNLLPTLSRTATANGTGVDCRALRGTAKAILNSAAGTGTSPTLAVKLQDSPNNSDWTDITGATFTQVVDAASRQSINVSLDGAARYIRAVLTIGGTNTPTFIFSLDLVSL
jgi:hypothetical protein